MSFRTLTPEPHFDCNGFTLLELLMTFSIIIILLMITVPSHKAMLIQSSSDVMRLQLLHAIYLTQSEAVSQGETVTLCHSSNQANCSGHWKEGYIVMSRKTIIYSFLNPANQGELYWRAFPLNQTQLDYLPSGMLNAENGTFWYCPHSKANPNWAIVISRGGRAREVVPEQPGGILKDGDRIIYCNEKQLS
jgi:type IV fimbrial biogenesis protein FimT